MPRLPHKRFIRVVRRKCLLDALRRNRRVHPGNAGRTDAPCEGARTRNKINAEILRRDGFVVDYVCSGQDALNRLRTSAYDIFLSDLNMPGVDGRRIYETLVAEFPDMLSRTAFITGDTMGQSSLALLKESALPYLEKPVSPSELRNLVGALVTGQKDPKDG